MPTRITHQHKTLILIILVLSLLTALTWITVSVFFSFTQTNLPPQVSKNLRPITPVLDTAVLDSVSERTQFTKQQLSEFVPVKKIDPNAVQEPEAVAEPEAEPSPTPTPEPETVPVQLADPSDLPSPVVETQP